MSAITAPGVYLRSRKGDTLTINVVSLDQRRLFGVKQVAVSLIQLDNLTV